MKKKKDEIQYSESISEILGSPPSSLVRYSTVVIFSVFVLLITLSSVVSYPDIIVAKAEITTVNPPANLISKTDARIIQLPVADRDTIFEGEVVAILESSVNLDEYFKLKSFLKNNPVPSEIKPSVIPDLYNLGEMQVNYNSIKKAITEQKSLENESYYLESIRATGEEILEIRTLIENLEKKKTIYEEIAKLETRRFSRVTILNSDSAIMPAEYDAARQEMLRRNADLEQVRLDISTEKIRLHSSESKLNELKIRYSERSNLLKSDIDESYRNLNSSVAEWEEKYLLVSPVKGIVVLSRYWSVNQSVKSGEQVASVVPFESGKIIGRVKLGMHRSGLVKPGNNVIIKLGGYPYLDYGSVKGVVSSRSLVPSDDSYIVEIAFPEGLSTVYGNKIELMQNMEAVAEIITEKKSLLAKIFSPVKYLVRKSG